MVTLFQPQKTGPEIKSASETQALALNNLQDGPNDGTVYAPNEKFHKQSPRSSFINPSGEPVSAANARMDDMTVPEEWPQAVLATAGLFHSRHVRISITEVTLHDDLELHDLFLGKQGVPPAELFAEVEVRFDPHIAETNGQNLVAHTQKLAHRSPDIFAQEHGTTIQPGYILYDGRVFDSMTELQLSFSLREADFYPRWSIMEWAFDPDEAVVDFAGVLALEPHTFEVKNENATITVTVEVFPLY
jgi:hypothetical protein